MMSTNECNVLLFLVYKQAVLIWQYKFSYDETLTFIGTANKIKPHRIVNFD